ncbi:MAG TPA: SMC-Scp complex subunit ScpB [Terracidiphilus sp.]|jgi:segregation and condensation protein B
MSLKAKLEAVIYAAEEPVTLAQLAALFAADALEWKAEQEAARAAGQTTEAGEPLPLLNEAFDYLGLNQTAESTMPEASPAPGEPAAETASDSNAGTDAEAAAEGSAETAPDSQAETDAEADQEDNSNTATDLPVEAEEDAKRLARLQDREVRAILRQLLDELIASYASDGRGVEIREIAGGYRMATKPECHDAVRLFVKSLKPALRLSLPALETLAVIAYKQPVTAPEVNEIRGVDSSAVFGTLLARKLITTAGRKQVIGRPILYKTTREFLLRFGLKDVSELPSMEEFEKMAELEFEEPEPAAEGEPTPAANYDLSLELDEIAEEPSDEPAANATPETREDLETAGTAAGQEPAANQELESPEHEPGSPANQAEPTPAEAAPAAPPPTEQAETETVPHDR